MLHRLADGLRRFFKFLSRKNRPTHKPFAKPADGLDGKEKKSEQSEPIGEQKPTEYSKWLDKVHSRHKVRPTKYQRQSPMSVLTGGLLK